MSNSKFIQVSSSILLEYIYSAQNDSINKFTESNVPLYKYDNIIFNGIKNETKGTYYTGSSINRTFDTYSTNEVSLLRSQNLNQNTYLLNVSDNNEMLYDTIKIHFISGFNFENNTGFILNAKCLSTKNDIINLLNFAVTKQDSFETLNSNSFYFAGKYYASYIEVKLLSLYNLIYTYYNTNPEVVALISPNGIKRDQYIQFDFAWISSIVKNDQVEIGTLNNSFAFDLELVDKYSNITATIRLAEDTGNYLEYEGLYNGNNIGDFLNDMNSSGFDYIMLHDIMLYESSEIIGNDPIWNVTQELQLSQSSNFSDVGTWRPIIKNPYTTAFKVDYILRLFNRLDQSQIWKTASIMVSGDNVAKFGIFNTSINLNSVATHKIYNKTVVKEVKLVKPIDNTQFTTKQIFSYLNSDIALSIDSNDKVGTIVPSAITQILITDNTTKLKFTFYKKSNNTQVPLGFTNEDTLYLSFKLNDGSNFKIIEVKLLDFNRHNGEILFKINSTEANKILQSRVRTFDILWENAAKELTTIVTGTFYSTLEWTDLKKYSIISDRDHKITEIETNYNTLLNNYNVTTDTLHKTIDDKDATINTLKNQITDKNKSETEKISSLQTLINTLEKELVTSSENYKKTIESLQHRLNVLEGGFDSKPGTPIMHDNNYDIVNLNSSVKNNRKEVVHGAEILEERYDRNAQRERYIDIQ